MALFPDRHPLLRQPSHVARINERHWLARDLLFVHSGYGAFAAGCPLPEVGSTLRSNALTGTDNPALLGSLGWVPNGADYQEYLLGYSGITTPLTLSVWWVGFASNVTDYCLTVRRASGSAGGFELRRSTAEGVTIVSMDASGGSNSSNGSGVFVANSWQHAVGVVASATSRTGYRNGDGGSTGTASRTAPSDLDRVAIGCSAAATPVVTASPAVTGIALPMVIGRVLDASEVARLHEEQRSNPWGLFAERRIWVPVSAAGGGSVTLTAAQGSYSITGQAAGLRVARTLTAAQGAYSLSGQAASMRTARQLVAGQGSYTLTGQAAALLATRRLVADQGAYALTGQSSALRAARQIAAAQGSYALTGQDATLTYSGAGAKTLLADAGSYALTGQVAALRVARTLTAEQGAYTYTGQDAALRRLYTLTVGQGAYALTGQPAGILRGLRLPAAQGSYTLSGQAATLTYSGAAGSTISIVQPYITVYFWRRTA